SHYFLGAHCNSHGGVPFDGVDLDLGFLLFNPAGEGRGREEKREKGEERERGSPAADRPGLGLVVGGPEVGHRRREEKREKGGRRCRTGLRSVVGGRRWVAGDGEDFGWEG
ncbi:hypothetical protein TIFTF001_056027, partial [Ficus carica]